MSDIAEDLKVFVDARASRRAREDAAKDVQSAKDYADEVRAAALEDRKEAEDVLRRARTQAQQQRADFERDKQQLETRIDVRDRELRAERLRLDDLSQDLAVTDKALAKRLAEVKALQAQAEQEMSVAKALQDKALSRSQEIEDMIARINEIWRPST